MKGFTIIELLVVLGITAMLSAIALGYTGVAQNQITLSVESAKIAETILRAKNLAIATYSTAPGICGYGVSIDVPDNEYSIFAYDPAGGGPCPSVASTTLTGLSTANEQPYSQSTWKVRPGTGVRLVQGNGDGLGAVLFYPPAPATLLSLTGDAFLPPGSAVPLNVHLSTVDGSASTTITVSPAGQVTF